MTASLIQCTEDPTPICLHEKSTPTWHKEQIINTNNKCAVPTKRNTSKNKATTLIIRYFFQDKEDELAPETSSRFCLIFKHAASVILSYSSIYMKNGR